MLESSWSIKLEQEPKLTAISVLAKPAFIYQGASNQLLTHSENKSVALPIRKEIIGLQALPQRVILMLTRYSLSCFDVLDNNIVFNLQFQNATSMVLGRGYFYVISGCDLFCYTLTGQEEFISHYPAAIESLAPAQCADLLNYSSKLFSEFIVGLNDSTMLRCQGVNVILDYGKIIGAPSSLCCIENGVLVGTHEGMVAYYETKKSKWKAKSIHPVYKVAAYESQKGILAIVARKDGSVELKDWKGKGQTISRIKLGEELVSIHLFDFRQQNNQQLICILKSGLVKAFNLLDEPKILEKGAVVDEVKAESDSIETLLKKKAALEYEIEQMKDKINSNNESPNKNQQMKFTSYLIHNNDGLVLRVSCEGGYISGIIFDEPIMPIEVQKVTQLEYLFRSDNVVNGNITCGVLAHFSFTARTFEVRPFIISLPRFWKWSYTPLQDGQIQGKLKFRIVQRNARFLKWLTQGFLFTMPVEERTKLENTHPLKMRFRNLYEKIDLEMIFYSKESRVEFNCDCLKTLGELVQDLVEYCGLKELDSQLQFSKEKVKLKETLQIIQKLSLAKISISSQMADAVNRIKFLLVKGQSARSVGCMPQFRKSHTEVMEQNRNLLAEINKKNSNTKQLGEALKVLGQFISQTSNVRFGSAKEAVIRSCRQAIKKKDFPTIISIMERGAAGIL